MRKLNKILKMTSLLVMVCMALGMMPASAGVNDPDMSNWFAYELPTPDEITGTPLDASNLLDAPAGKHGFLTSTDEADFVFEDGTKIKFWGVNVTGENCSPSRENSVNLAKRISQSGFNMVRLHLLEAGERDGIWGRKADGGRIINADAMDRLCFLINELKKRGIYIWIDQVLSKPPTIDDEFSDMEALGSGLKGFSYYDEQLIEFQKEYADMLFNWYNPYTGMKLKDDPAIAIVEFKNEDVLISFDTDSSEYYHNKLEKMFNEWLVNKYGTRSNLVNAWQRYKAAESNNHIILNDSEDPTRGTVKLIVDDYEIEPYSVRRQNDTKRFITEIQMNYFNEMSEYLRSIGVKCRLSGTTSWNNSGIERPVFYSNTGMDLISLHPYRSHTNTTDYSNTTVRWNLPEPTLSNYETSIIGHSGFRNVYGMPSVLSEWNDVAPNKYRSDSLLITSAYSAFHGMHPLAFHWSNVVELDGFQELGTADQSTYVKTPFGFADTPEYVLALPTAARIYLRGDVKEAEAGFYAERLKDDEYYSTEKQWIDYYIRDFENYMSLVGKTGMSFDSKAYDPEYNNNDVIQLTKEAYVSGKPFVSITGELSSDVNSKVFKMNTARTQAAAGFIGTAAIELDDVIFDVDNNFATVYLSSLSDDALYNCDSMLLTLSGDTRNTGMVMSDDETAILDAGTPPVLCEPITGTFTIKTTDNIEVYALKSSGKRSHAKTVYTTSAGYKAFDISASDKSLNFEIVRTTSSSAKNPHISFGSTETANMFSDVGDSHPNKKAIERMAIYDYISGDSSGKFNPDSAITRKDFFKMLFRAMRLEGKVWYDKSSSYFTDITVGNDGYAELAGAYNLGIITREKKWSFSGSKYYIYPDNNVTRDQAMTYMAQFMGITQRDINPDSSFSLNSYSDYSSVKGSYSSTVDYWHKVMGLGYLDPINGKIEPKANITRAQAAQMIYNLVWE